MIVLVGVMAVLVGGRANVALGDPNLPNITPHRHFIQNGGRLVQVGPRVCDDPSLQSAFHNLKGPEITSRACSSRSSLKCREARSAVLRSGRARDGDVNVRVELIDEGGTSSLELSAT
jgi:hypothetical protein